MKNILNTIKKSSPNVMKDPINVVFTIYPRVFQSAIKQKIQLESERLII